MRLPEYVINDKSLLTAPREKLRQIQDERLRTMVSYVHEKSPFWNEKLNAAGVDPETFAGIDDVLLLPTCTKKELQQEQLEHGFLGRYTCTEREQWARYFTTSGTTGTPLRRVYSKRDWQHVLDRFARSPLYTADDVLLLTTPVDGLVGPTAGLEAGSNAGALVITGGLWSTKRKIETIVGMRPSKISGSTSYILHLTEVAASMGVDLASCGVRSVGCVGEPGAAVELTWAKLSERFGGASLADGYGMSEIFPLGGNCAYSRSIHLSEDMVLVECLKPNTNEPVAQGEVGELVYTNLIGDTQPLLRYRSGDLGRLSDGSPCECGHTHVRIEGSILGRADDMIWYRGVNFFPSAVEQAISEIEGVAPDHYLIVLTEDAGFPHLSIRVEQSDERGNPDTLAMSVATRIKKTVGVTATVEVLSTGQIARPNAGEKARHVIDYRHVEEEKEQK